MLGFVDDIITYIRISNRFPNDKIKSVKTYSNSYTLYIYSHFNQLSPPTGERDSIVIARTQLPDDYNGR